MLPFTPYGRSWRSGGRKQVADLFRVGEALFPLVALACAKVKRDCLAGSSAYLALQSAAMAGCRSCVRWLLAHKATRNNAKECAAVLKGLCGGGYVDMARQLVVRGHCGCGCCCCCCWEGILEWPVDEREATELREDVAESVLYEACTSRGADVEVVKWVVAQFGMNQPWQLIKSLQYAIIFGNFEVYKWMLQEILVLGNSFLSVPWLEKNCLINFADLCVLGKAPLHVKWWYGNVPISRKQSSIEDVFHSLLCNKNSCVEVCDWMVDHFGTVLSSEERQRLLPYIASGEILKWFVDRFQVELSEELVSKCCQQMGDLSVIKWFVLDKRVAVTPLNFVSACANTKGDLSLVKWLLTQLGPVQAQLDMIKALEMAVSAGNLCIAVWLEESFHVLKFISATQQLANSSLANIFSHMSGARKDEELASLQWLLQQLRFSEATVPVLREAVELACNSRQTGPVLLLVEGAFREIPPLKDSQKHIVLKASLNGANLSKVTQLVQSVPFSAEIVSTVLSESDSLSSKLNNNHLLFRMLALGKRGCSKWLIDSFVIDFPEVLRMFSQWLRHSFENIDLRTWKLILKKFPAIDTLTIQEHLIYILGCCPAALEFTVKKFGWDIDTTVNCLRRSRIPEARLWIQQHTNTHKGT
ncbi:hypothetical protein Pelo_4172 [Pelomyxa schiedti]|nr:hypothetical protein Pelo_4172 [Pelomyxa schiedti]